MLILATALLLVVPQEPTSEAAPHAHPELLVSTEWLADAPKDGMVVLDVRESKDYAAGHLPGARSMPVGVTFDPERPGDMAPVAQIARELGARGVDAETHVVLIDEGRSTRAARVFWTLELCGHRRVAVVDGGMARWNLEKRSLSKKVPEFAEVVYEPGPPAAAMSTTGSLLEDLDGEGCTPLDSRSSREFEAGRIPGAIHIDWVRNYTDEEAAVFLPPAQLRALYADVIGSGKRVHAYCGSGQRAAVTYLALRLLGSEDPTNYDGSWRVWARDPKARIEK